MLHSMASRALSYVTREGTPEEIESDRQKKGSSFFLGLMHGSLVVAVLWTVIILGLRAVFA
jgi:hypothetical protein